MQLLLPDVLRPFTKNAHNQKRLLIMEKNRRIRVLIANPGLDVHDAGAKYVSQALRDAGIEVIYLGIRQTAEGIVNSAIQEDVDVIGLSVLSGKHNTIVPYVMKLLRDKGAADSIKLVVGGIVPPDEVQGLKEQGVSQVFLPGTPRKQIIDYIFQLTEGAG